MRQIIPFIFTLAASIGLPFTANAQISIESRPIKVITACFNDAINANKIRKKGTNIIFRCDGSPALSFYQTLGKHQTYDAQLTGAYQARKRFIYYDKVNNACYNLYEDNNGRPINNFFCEMTYDAGDFIKE